MAHPAAVTLPSVTGGTNLPRPGCSPVPTVNQPTVNQPTVNQPTVVHETHTGLVVLAGDRAYKVKKPVDVGFLDLRRRERRLNCCEREVELNRRLAPDVYLGVAHYFDPDAVEGEPVVLMRRMPDQLRLSTLVRSGRHLDDTIVRLARVMAAFHLRSARTPEISAEGTRDAIAGRWDASFEQVGAYCGTVIDSDVGAEMQQRVGEFLIGRAPLFDRRIREGRVVDGHGDLIADDIFCLDDGPRILDCLEFDDRLRRLDGLDDIAFLAMDLEMLGAGRLARLLFDRYADFAGDPAPAALRHHYVAYRAFVRVKVECLRHSQGQTSAAAKAMSYADLALRHLRSGTVRMVLVGGLPGAGKSTVAGLVADRLGAVLLSTDHSSDRTDRTHTTMLRRAEELIRHGESVVLDASWTHSRFRADAARVAERSAARLFQAECWAPPELRRFRLASRYQSVSDADPENSDQQATGSDWWPEAIRLLTTQGLRQTANELLTHLAGSAGSMGRQHSPLLHDVSFDQRL